MPKPAACAALLATTLVLSAPARAADDDPLGTYLVDSILGDFTSGDGDDELFSYDAGKIKVKRSKVVYKLDGPDDLFKVTLKLRLRDDLENAPRQTVTVASGSVAFKETITGQSMGWGGDFNAGKYELWRKSSGRWRIKSTRKLDVQDILGFSIFDDSSIEDIRTKATRREE